jgi:cellulose synthase/poly-beta-1,6-N-acetylglucosamine synthase-like glycosyltransferase
VIEDLADLLLALVAGWWEVVVRELSRRSFAEWLLFSTPIVLLAEGPRYYLPSCAVALLKWLGLPRVDQAARERFLASKPLVSCVLAGRNEGAIMGQAVTGLLDQDYENIEIIVADDCSDDDTSAQARRAARGDPRVRLLRNAARTGRGGRPSASNLGLRFARGEFVLSLDADTTFDRSVVRRMLEPFADPSVGVVAGNILPRNGERSLVARLQIVEYALGIDLHKRWSDLFGCTLMASGAIGCFRRQAVEALGGWNPEVAEDSDISLRMKQAGWKIAFAPRAVALTDVPESLRAVARQRTRWDRGGFNVYVRRHARLWNPRTVGWSFSTELWEEFYFTVAATFLYPAYLLAVLWLRGPLFLSFILALTLALYQVFGLLAYGCMVYVCDRLEQPWRLLAPTALLPFYKGYLRWVRLKAFTMELCGIKPEDTFLPPSAWLNANWRWRGKVGPAGPTGRGLAASDGRAGAARAVRR